MASTKDNIIAQSVKLFNKHGFTNVSMKDIADALEISPGNLTYHFKKKEDLLVSIYRELVYERQELYGSITVLPGIANIHALLKPLMDLHIKYRIIYVDMLEIARLFPSIDRLNKEHINVQINAIKSVLDYSVESGNMLPEQRKGQYYDLAHTCWMLFHFWLQQQLITGNKGSFHDQARFAIWNLVYPLLTTKGRHNFKKVEEEQTTYINSIL